MKTAARLIRISGFPSPLMLQRGHDSPTPMTRSVLSVRCLSSVGLNQKILVLGCGV